MLVLVNAGRRAEKLSGYVVPVLSSGTRKIPRRYQ